MARSLNKAELIGNLTRDPELRYTPQGTAVCTFGLATNRQWTTDGGEKKEDAEFHRIVAWNKLAELCTQLLAKGRKVYVEGRLQTRRWTGQDNIERTTTEIVISDMIILDSRGAREATPGDEFNVPEEPQTSDAAAGLAVPGDADATSTKSDDSSSKTKKASPKAKKDQTLPEKAESDDDIPF
jgi:single-strand DNA-binding protein